MTVIVPDDLEAFEGSLTASQLARVVQALGDQRIRLQEVSSDPALAGGHCGTYAYSVDLHMPRFATETQADLSAVLEALGMPLAFYPGQADFSGSHAPADAADRI